jgi:hypothetical protein
LIEQFFGSKKPSNALNSSREGQREAPLAGFVNSGEVLERRNSAFYVYQNIIDYQTVPRTPFDLFSRLVMSQKPNTDISGSTPLAR